MPVQQVFGIIGGHGGDSMKKALPVGVENFKDMVKSGYYYVDKTLLIKELLDLKGKVNLFTRPRRFGKTLNLSMLRYFFEDSGDMEKNHRNKELFRGIWNNVRKRKIFRNQKNSS